MKTISLSILASAVLTVCMPAAAATFTNGSFEAGTPVGNYGDVSSQRLLSGDNTTLSGWTVTGAAGNDIAWIGAGNPYNLTGSEGNNFLDLTGWQSGGVAGKGVAQTFDTVNGQQYSVSFALGNSTNYNYGASSALTVTAGNLSQTVFSLTNDSTNSWDRFALNFVAQGSSTTLSFTGLQATYYIGLDNVSVTAVPEPETYAMLLMGLGVIGAIARRCKAQQA
jgi:hypothetical protein